GLSRPRDGGAPPERAPLTRLPPMPVNTDYVGHRYPPSGPYAVTAEQIAAFADAVRAESPLHRDEVAAREAGYPGVVAPPTFAVTLSQRCEAQLVRDEQAGIDFARVVHG